MDFIVDPFSSYFEEYNYQSVYVWNFFFCLLIIWQQTQKGMRILSLCIMFGCISVLKRVSELNFNMSNFNLLLLFVPFLKTFSFFRLLDRVLREVENIKIETSLLKNQMTMVKDDIRKVILLVLISTVWYTRKWHLYPSFWPKMKEHGKIGVLVCCCELSLVNRSHFTPCLLKVFRFISDAL